MSDIGSLNQNLANANLNPSILGEVDPTQTESQVKKATNKQDAVTVTNQAKAQTNPSTPPAPVHHLDVPEAPSATQEFAAEEEVERLKKKFDTSQKETTKNSEKASTLDTQEAIASEESDDADPARQQRFDELRAQSQQQQDIALEHEQSTQALETQQSELEAEQAKIQQEREIAQTQVADAEALVESQQDVVDHLQAQLEANPDDADLQAQLQTAEKELAAAQQQLDEAILQLTQLTARLQTITSDLTHISNRITASSDAIFKANQQAALLSAQLRLIELEADIVGLVPKGLGSGSLASLLAAVVELISKEHVKNLIEVIKAATEKHKAEADDNVKKLQESIEKAGEAKKGGLAGQIFGWIAAVAALIVSVISAVALTVGTLGVGAPAAGALLAGAIIGIVGSVIGLLESIPVDGKIGGQGLISAGLSELTFAITNDRELSDKVGKWLTFAIEIALAVIAAALTFGAAGIAKIGSFLKTLGTNITKAASQIAGTVATHTVKALAQQAVKAIVKAVRAVLKAIQEFVQQLIKWVSKTAKEASNVAKSFLEPLQTASELGIKGSLSAIGSQLTDFFKSLGNALKQAGSFLENFKIDDLKDTFRNAFNKSQSQWQEVQSSLDVLRGRLTAVQAFAELGQASSNVAQSALKKESADAQAEGLVHQANQDWIENRTDTLREVLAAYQQQIQELSQSISDIIKSSHDSANTIRNKTPLSS